MKGLALALAMLATAVAATAQEPASHDVVVMHCNAHGTYLADEASSSPSFPTPSGRDCAEQLSRLLAAGFNVAHAGAGDASAPVLYTLIRRNGPATRRAREASPEVAILRCREEDWLGRLVLGGSDTTAGVTGIRQEYGASCAEGLRAALDGGLSILEAHTGKSDSAYVVYTLTSQAPRSRRAARRRAVTFDAAVLRCTYYYERRGEGYFYVSGGSSTTSPPLFSTETCDSCAEALAVLLGAGFSVHDMKPGENADQPVYTLLRQSRKRERR